MLFREGDRRTTSSSCSRAWWRSSTLYGDQRERRSASTARGASSASSTLLTGQPSFYTRCRPRAGRGARGPASSACARSSRTTPRSATSSCARSCCAATLLDRARRRPADRRLALLARHAPPARVRGPQPDPAPLDRPRGGPGRRGAAARARRDARTRRRSSSGAARRSCATRATPSSPTSSACRRPAEPTGVCDLVVVGAGPARARRRRLRRLRGPWRRSLLDAVATGGQAATSSRIENYLGFPAGISGAELAERAPRPGAEVRRRASACRPRRPALERGDGHHVVSSTTASADRSPGAWSIATGARYRRLDRRPASSEFEGTSVYYAATPVEAQLCRDDPVVVVGGGNSAGQAALFLARARASVRLVVREPS